MVSIYYNSPVRDANGYAKRTEALLHDATFPRINLVRPNAYKDDNTDIDPAGSLYINTLVRPNFNQIIEYTAASVDAFSKSTGARFASAIHSCSNFRVGLIALTLARKFKVPFFYEVRGFWDLTAGEEIDQWENTERFRIERKIERLLWESATHLFCISETQKRYILQNSDVSASNLTVVHNGLPKPLKVRKKSEAKLTFKFSKRKKALCYLGSITSYENIDFLIDKFAGNNKVELLIAGQGPDFSRIQNLIAQNTSATNVHLLGHLEREQIQILYENVDLFLIPRKPSPVTSVVPPMKIGELVANRCKFLANKIEPIKEVCERFGVAHNCIDFSNAVAFDSAVEDSLNAPIPSSSAKEKSATWSSSTKLFETAITQWSQKKSHNKKYQLSNKKKKITLQKSSTQVLGIYLELNGRADLRLTQKDFVLSAQSAFSIDGKLSPYSSNLGAYYHYIATNKYYEISDDVREMALQPWSFKFKAAEVASLFLEKRASQSHRGDVAIIAPLDLRVLDGSVLWLIGQQKTIEKWR